MRKRGIVCIGAALLAALIIIGFGHQSERTLAAQGGQVQAPRFEVDPYWPKPLPNNAVMGSVLGVAADAQDNILILQRPDTVERSVTAATTDSPPANPRSRSQAGFGAKQADEWIRSAIKADGSCCSPFPSFILHYDQAGNLLRHFGGPPPGYGVEWPDFPHGLHVDYKGNIWIASNGEADSRILKFDKDGKFLLALGTRGVRGNSNDLKNLGSPSSATVDPATDEVYVSDGSLNRRIIVFDAETGEYKRHWGAYGNPPDDTPFTYDPAAPPKQFASPHCVMLSKDGLVYVCDWRANRIQVFREDGTFVKEGFVERATRGGTVWGIAFSRDPEERYLYVSDGSANRKIHILRRETLEVLTSFGSGGRQPGQFLGAMHNIATDAEGNLYVTEIPPGSRVQRFLFKGVDAVPRDQGVLWPRSAQ